MWCELYVTLLIVLGLAILAVAAAPLLTSVIDRQAGWPLAGIFLVAAWILLGQLPNINGGEALTYSREWIPDLLAPGVGVNLALRGDALSVFFALLALGIGSVVFIYSAAYLPKNKGNTSFYTIMSAFMASILLLVLADDAFVLFVAWELVSLASFMLIARSGGKGGELGSQRTLVLTFIGGLTLLVALAIAASQAGTTSISGILRSGFWAENPTLTAVLAVLVAVSAFTKSAQLPFHFWLPEAMAAATPVSAFLHAAAVVKAGIYLLLRFSTAFHDVRAWNLLLIVVGMSTAVMASFFAIQKTDLKKLTAYSTVSHLGWIVATVGVGTPFALAAALVHTLAHALFKSSLFMLIGVIDHQTGTREATRLGSSWRRMPFTFASVCIAAGSMAAVPPTMGFVSKEGMLDAFLEAPLSNAGVVLLLVAAGVGALFTFTYSARIVFDGFVDGDRDMSYVTEAKPLLWVPAALPGVLSLPLVLALGTLDGPIDAAVGVITASPHSHLALWHGFTVPLGISLVVLLLGIVGVYYRKRIWALIDARKLFPKSGNELLHGLQLWLNGVGRKFGAMADSFNPARHLAFMFILVVLLAGSVTIAGLLHGGIDGQPLQPRYPGIDRPTDLLPLIAIAAAVVALARTRKRLVAVVLIGVVGVAVTLQILTLGAPDVALTQFMVEALTVVIMMMVVRQQPDSFHPVRKNKQAGALVLSVLVGLSTFGAAYFLLGRSGRSELAEWYIDNAPGITGGDNIVNTILVEFRAFDTLGELSVLGMAAIVIAAVVTSMPRYPFAKGTHPEPFGESTINTMPLRVLLKVLIPLLIILSLMIFWRGHNQPGGGFIAALVAGTALMVTYLSYPRDKAILPARAPIYLTGVGIITAVVAGLIGLTHGSFLYAIHGHWAGQHWTTAMIFDVGVYLAVLGMLSMAINALGGYLRPGMEYKDLNFSREDSPLPTLVTVEQSLANHMADFSDENRHAPEEHRQQQILRQAAREKAALAADKPESVDKQKGEGR